MKLRTQIILLSVVPLLFLLLLLALALVVLKVTQDSALGSQRSAEVFGQSQLIMETLNRANRAVLNYGSAPSAASLKAYRASRLPFADQVGKLRLLVAGSHVQEARVAQLSVLLRDGVEVLDQYQRDIQAGHRDAARALTTSPRVASLGTNIELVIAQINDAQRASTLAALSRSHHRVRTLTFALLACCLFAIILTLFAARRFGGGITLRLQRLGDNARRMALGVATAPIQGNDEIVALDRVYQTMMQRIAREHHVASTLQQALLPQALPRIPGLRLDTAYVTAAAETEIGGDWYDAFIISDREVGLSIGDVAGHGLRAAAIMGASRQAIRTAARISRDPAEVLRHVNVVLCADEEDVLVTAFFAVLDVTSGALRYASAGHPAPLVVRSGGGIEILQSDGLVLGVDTRTRFSPFATHLDVGSGLILYTDGVIEAGLDYFKGMEMLASAVSGEYRNASTNIAEAIQHRVLAGMRPHDDAALLFVGVTALGEAALAPRSRHWRLDARAESSARRVQRALLWHLGELAPLHADFSAAELIFSELIGNVARHTPGPAEVILECEGDHPVLRVCDQGEPFAPQNIAEPDLLAEGGRGLFLVRTMAHGLTVARTHIGNCVSAILPVPLSGASDAR